LKKLKTFCVRSVFINSEQSWVDAGANRVLTAKQC